MLTLHLKVVAIPASQSKHVIIVSNNSIDRTIIAFTNVSTSYDDLCITLSLPFGQHFLRLILFRLQLKEVGVILVL